MGVHNDESYFKLKKKKPIDNTEKRMENVKKYADQVFFVFITQFGRCFKLFTLGVCGIQYRPFPLHPVLCPPKTWRDSSVRERR